MPDIQLTLSEDERQYLLQFLNDQVGDTRVEVRRTDSPKFRDRVLAEEQLLQGLIAKLQQAK
jgi:hypothetical protein